MEEIKRKYYKSIIDELCKKKLEQDNQIDIDAYCLGLKDFAEHLINSKLTTSN